MHTTFDGTSGVEIDIKTINHILQAEDLILLTETSVSLENLLAKLDK